MGHQDRIRPGLRSGDQERHARRTRGSLAPHLCHDRHHGATAKRYRHADGGARRDGLQAVPAQPPQNGLPRDEYMDESRQKQAEQKHRRQQEKRRPQKIQKADQRVHVRLPITLPSRPAREKTVPPPQAVRTRNRANHAVSTLRSNAPDRSAPDHRCRGPAHRRRVGLAHAVALSANRTAITKPISAPIHTSSGLRYKTSRELQYCNRHMTRRHTAPIPAPEAGPQRQLAALPRAPRATPPCAPSSTSSDMAHAGMSGSRKCQTPFRHVPILDPILHRPRVRGASLRRTRRCRSDQ